MSETVDSDFNINKIIELKEELLSLISEYRKIAPKQPSRSKEFSAHKQSMMSGMVSVKEYDELKFLYHSDCEVRAVEYFFKQFRQFRNDRPKDYALVALSDSSIGVIDLHTEEIIASADLGAYTNWDFCVPEIKSILTEDNIGIFLDQAVRVEKELKNSDLSGEDLMGWLFEKIHAWRLRIGRVNAVLGNNAFISVVANENGILRNIMLRLDLSEISQGEMRVIEPPTKIYLAPWASLTRAISYSKDNPADLVILQEVRYPLFSL